MSKLIEVGDILEDTLDAAGRRKLHYIVKTIRDILEMVCKVLYRI